MMSRLIPCPGSFKMCFDYPDKCGDNEYSKEGILAHWVAADCLKNDQPPSKWLGQTPTNDQMVDSDMVRYINGYIEYIKTIIPVELDFNLEAKLETSEFSGTPDILKYDSASNLTIVDLKYGFKIVNVYKNWQLIFYAWLWWKVYGRPRVENVKFIIYQPRPMHPDNAVKEWRIPFSKLEDIYFPKIEETLKNIYLPNALTTSGNHCHYCSAMLYCRTNLETCLNIVNSTGVVCADEIDNWTLGKQLEMFEYALGILKQRVSVLKTVGEVITKGGGVVPGYGMVERRGNRSWKISDRKAKIFGIPYKKAELVSPREAELSGIPKSLVDLNVTRKSTMKFSRLNISSEANNIFGAS